MNRRTMFGACVCAVLGVAFVVNAAPKPKLPKITGGGVAENLNAGPEFPETLQHFSISAHATAEAEPAIFPAPFFPSVVAADYPAKGHVNLRNVLADNQSVTVSQTQGDVVCIANLGPSVDVDGDGNPELNVWEIRFQITKSQIANDDGELEEVDLSQFPPLYGSIYVQDGGKEDFIDENFERDLLLNPDCVVNPFFGLEPVTHGNITVHN